MNSVRPLAVVSVAGLCLGLGLGVAGCSKEENASVTPASGAGEADATGGRGASPGASGLDDALLERLPSLARVEDALGGMPVDVRSWDEKKLEEARAWIAANRPDLDPREAELAAQMLAIVDDFINTEDMSVADVKGVAETQIVQLWAMDADGDGILSEEEARATMDQMMDFGDLIGDRYASELDADGDGTVSGEERQALDERMQANMMPLAEQMIERAQLATWDENGDGFLSDAERAAGEATIEFQDFDGDGEYSEQERMAAYQSMLMDMNNNLLLLEMPGMQEMTAEFQADVAAQSQELQQSLPQAGDYDLDGDGSMSAVEQEAYDQEMAAWRGRQEAFTAELQERGRDLGARLMLMQFDSAVAALDSDGDGRLTTEEWSVSLDGLRGDRDARMFNYLYDSDRSGGVSDAEVARFMDAYDSGSTYADADLNGTVDQSDLQFFVTQVAGQ